MPDIAAFLDANTIRCAPLHARISRVQCGINIRSGDIGHCANCPEAALAVMSCPEPINIWGRPRNPRAQKTEKPVTQPAKTYTRSEIAAMARVAKGSMWYAMNSLHQGKENLSPTALRVKEVLDNLGITADQVRSGGWDKLAGTLPSQDAATAQASEELNEFPETLNNQSGNLNGQAPSPVSKAPGINQEVEDAVAKMETEGADRATRRTPAAESHPVSKFLDAVADDLAAMEPEEDSEGEDEPGSPPPASSASFPPLRPNYATDMPRLAHIPLEALIAELTRRLPRASVIIQ